MYEYFSGILDYIGEDYIVIDVNGIGYKIFTSYSTLNSVQIGTNIKIYSHLVVKEDDLTLYGFISREELKLFKMLISVSGVGPKASLALLSQFSYNDITLAIISKDISKLTKASGVGKKTAERIVLELKDKIEAQNAISPKNPNDNFENFEEAISALVALGYGYNVSVSAVAKAREKNNTLDNIIKDALKQLSRI